MRNSVGRMRERVMVMKPGRVSDGALGFNREDQTQGDFWARVTPVGSKEVFQYQHLEQVITHRVTMRANEAVRQGVTLRWKTLPQPIDLYVEVVERLGERNEFIKVICRQGGNL